MTPISSTPEVRGSGKVRAELCALQGFWFLVIPADPTRAWDPAPAQPWDLGELLAGLGSSQDQRGGLKGGSELLGQLCRNPGSQRAGTA